MGRRASGAVMSVGARGVRRCNYVAGKAVKGSLRVSRNAVKGSLIVSHILICDKYLAGKAVRVRLESRGVT